MHRLEWSALAADRGRDSHYCDEVSTEPKIQFLRRFLPVRLTNSLSAFQIQADFNVISELAANTFSGLSNLTTVNLTHNRLEKFAINSLTLRIEAGGGRGEHWTVALVPNSLPDPSVRPSELLPKFPLPPSLYGSWPAAAAYLQTTNRQTAKESKRFNYFTGRSERD